MRSFIISYGDDPRRFEVFEDGRIDPPDCGVFTYHPAPGVVRLVDSERPDYPTCDIDFHHIDAVEQAESPAEIEDLLRRQFPGFEDVLGAHFGTAAQKLFDLELARREQDG